MIVLDGIEYRCDISIDRAVTLKEWYRITTADNLTHRKLAGSKHTANITFASTKDRASYEALFSALSAETPYHTLTVPWGDDTLTIEAMVTSVADTLITSSDGKYCFSGLKVAFEER